MRRAILLGLLFLVGVVSTASAQPYGGGKRRAITWDNKGWTMLGERTVNGRVDRDRIDVGRYEGRFSKLMVVVHDSDLEMLEFKVNFADRTSYDPRMAFYFRENDSTRAFDLPAGERVINHIDLKYRNVGRWGDARVQVWGFKVNAAPPRPAYTWDTNGWQMLGERTVNGRVDRDTISVGRYEGRFQKLNIVVLDDDMELLEFRVTFADRTSFDPRLSYYFRESSRSRFVDLPAGERVINRIDLKYRNVGRNGPGARVQVWGQHAAPARVAFTWNNQGWRMLGEQQVNGRLDRDRINIDYGEGKFSQLMVVVLDSDIELLEFDVQFNRGESWRPSVRQVFREQTRTRAIDLPGDRSRRIKYIDLKYKNLPGGGPGRVQVWGR